MSATAIDKRAVPHSGTPDAPAFALPQPYFIAPEWHQRDIDLVFKRRWLFVDHVARLAKPGDFVTYSLDRQSVVVTRGTDGKLHAFHNSCRHRGSRLCKEPSGNAKAFMCPTHAWTYDLDGTLKTAPRMPNFDRSLYPAIPVRVEEWNGLVFINFSEHEPLPVADYLADADFGKYQLGCTKIIHDRTYVLQANWKLAAETYNECYHCALVHPDLCRLVDPLKDLEAWDDASTGDDYVIYTPDMRDAIIKPGARSFTMDGDVACRKPMGDGSTWQEGIAALSWYPQFGLFAFPDYAYTLDWKPISAEETLFRSIWMVHEDAVEGVDYDVGEIIKLGNLINEEDGALCENVQLGVRSDGYRPGPYHPVFEGPVRGFNRVYLSAVGTDPYPEGAK